jgi:hypothetical protein
MISCDELGGTAAGALRATEAAAAMRWIDPGTADLPSCRIFRGVRRLAIFFRQDASWGDKRHRERSANVLGRSRESG